MFLRRLNVWMLHHTFNSAVSWFDGYLDETGHHCTLYGKEKMTHFQEGTSFAACFESLYSIYCPFLWQCLSGCQVFHDDEPWRKLFMSNCLCFCLFSLYIMNCTNLRNWHPILYEDIVSWAVRSSVMSLWCKEHRFVHWCYRHQKKIRSRSQWTWSVNKVWTFH